MKNNKYPRPVRTPQVLQIEVVECGAASLGIVLAYYGKFIRLEELRVVCSVSRDGSKSSDLVEAARQIGLDAKEVKMSMEDCLETKGPLIIHWNFNHFLVFEGIDKKGQIWLNDPALGRRKVSLKEFDESFTGVALKMNPGSNFRRSGHSFSFVRSMKTRLTFAKMDIYLLSILGFLCFFPSLILPVLFQVYIDDIIISGYYEWLVWIIAIMICILPVSYLLYLVQYKIINQMEISINVTSQSKFFWHVLRLPQFFYLQRNPTEIAYRMKINEQVASTFSTCILEGSLSIFGALLFLLVMFLYQPLLASIAVICASLNFLTLRRLLANYADISAACLKESIQLNATSINGLRMIENLKCSGREDEFFQRWAGLETRVLNAYQSLASLQYYIRFFPDIFMYLALVLTLGIGAFEVLNGSLSIGSLFAFQLLLVSFFVPLNRLFNLFTDVQNISTSLSRLDDVLAAEPEPVKFVNEINPGFESAHLEGKVEFLGVTFGYQQNKEAIFNNFNLVVDPGKKIALVGRSGSGKTTLLLLLSGIYKSWEGEILFDGKPANAYERQNFSRSVGVVSQNYFIFNDTVRNNLNMWDDSISEDNLRRACKDACIEDLIAERGGFDMLIQEGGQNLSGGQKQRLEIARALLNDPSILILDEATSDLDTITELNVIQNLKARQCTTIIAAHRLSTIRDCDEIIVLDKGQIVERGTHAELIGKGTYYAELLKEI